MLSAYLRRKKVYGKSYFLQCRERAVTPPRVRLVAPQKRKAPSDKELDKLMQKVLPPKKEVPITHLHDVEVLAFRMRNVQYQNYKEEDEEEKKEVKQEDDDTESVCSIRGGEDSDSDGDEEAYQKFSSSEEEDYNSDGDTVTPDPMTYSLLRCFQYSRSYQKFSMRLSKAVDGMMRIHTDIMGVEDPYEPSQDVINESRDIALVVSYMAGAYERKVTELHDYVKMKLRHGRLRLRRDCSETLMNKRYELMEKNVIKLADQAFNRATHVMRRFKVVSCGDDGIIYGRALPYPRSSLPPELRNSS